jgi:hypothetical protein
MELAFPISGNVDVLEPPRRGHQIARVVAVTIAFALGATLSPCCSNELIELFTHHFFYHDPNSALGKSTQMLVEFLLIRQWCDCLLLR